MSGQLKSIPASLPPYLYDHAKAGPDSVASHATGDSGSFSPTSSVFPRPLSTIQPQYTGQSLQPQATGNALRPTPTGPAFPPRSPFPLAAQHTGQNVPWDITATEKANADRFFDTLDTQRKGYIDGDTAVPFFTQSKLSDDVLAQIWYEAHCIFFVSMHSSQGRVGIFLTSITMDFSLEMDLPSQCILFRPSSQEKSYPLPFQLR